MELQCKEFDTFANLENVIKDFENKNFIQLYKRNCQTVENALKRNPNRNVKEDLKYVRIQYSCIHGGKRFRTNSNGDRPNTSTYQMECPFSINVLVNKEGTKLIIKTVNDEHNHDISSASFSHLPRQRKLDDELKAEVKNMLDLKANKKMLQLDVSSRTGKVVTIKDIHNIGNPKGKAPSDKETLNILVNEMKSIPGSTVEITKDESGMLTGIFFQDPPMQSFFDKFPELLLIDSTYKLNDLRLPLYVMLCVDGNGESKIVAFWIVSDESRETIEAMMRIFKKHNPKWEDIGCIMADKDMNERNTLLQELPNAALQICLFHVLRTFKREVTCEKLKISADQRLHSLELLQKITYCKSQSSYDDFYAELKDTGLNAVIDYFDKNWHPIKEQWVEGFKVKSCNMLNRTNNRVESINQKLKSVISKFSNVVTFFRDLMKIVRVLRMERDHRAMKMFQKTKILIDSCDSQLKPYVAHLTAYAFSHVKRQFSLYKSVTFEGEIFPESLAISIVTSEGSVTVTRNTCECSFFTSIGLPCRHIFFFREKVGDNMFCPDACLSRWTKAYYKRSHIVFEDFQSSETSSNFSITTTPRRRRVRILSGQDKFRRAHDLCKKLSSIIAEKSTREFNYHIEMIEHLLGLVENSKPYTIQEVVSGDSSTGKNSVFRSFSGSVDAQPVV